MSLAFADSHNISNPEPSPEPDTSQELMPIQDNILEVENEQLRNEIRDLKLENRQLKNYVVLLNTEIDSLEDQIVSMTKEFVAAIQQLNEWFGSKINN